MKFETCLSICLLLHVFVYLFIYISVYLKCLSTYSSVCIYLCISIISLSFTLISLLFSFFHYSLYFPSFLIYLPSSTAPFLLVRDFSAVPQVAVHRNEGRHMEIIAGRSNYENPQRCNVVLSFVALYLKCM